jgi:hypothetical protein
MLKLICVTGRKNYETVKKTNEQVNEELSEIGLKYNEFSGLPYYYTLITDDEDKVKKIKELLKKSNYIFKVEAIGHYNKDEIEILSGYSRLEIEELFQNEEKKLNNYNKKKVYENIFKIASDIFKKFSEQFKENSNNIKIKKIYLCEIEKECLRLIEKELKKKIKILEENKSDSGTGTGSNNSVNLVEVINNLIKSIDDFIEKQNKKESTYDDLAKIFDCASKLCNVAAETIKTGEEISTLCSILKIAAELASLIHPLLLQLQIKIQLKIDAINIIEIKFEENFEVFVSKIIDYAIKKEIMNKENIQSVHFKIR